MEIKRKKVIKVGMIFLLLCLCGLGVFFAIRFLKKSDDKIPAKSDKHIVMLTVRDSYGGPVYENEDYCQCHFWTVYYDGTVEYYESYSLSGATTMVSWELDEETFNELATKLEKNFMKHEADDEGGFDGSWITIVYTDEKGNVRKQFDGYIYGLEYITKLLHSEERYNVEKNPL